MATRTEKGRAKDDEKRLELHEHLGELRSRILRSIFYVAVGGIICYFYFQPIYNFLFQPMLDAAAERKMEVKIVFTQFTQAFFVVLQISVVAGLIVASPFVTMEMWAFIAPALTRNEKKPIRFLAPLGIALFAAGVLLAYWVSKFAIKWFISYVSWFPGGVLYQEPNGYVMFMLKMMAIFGAVFQLPVILAFLAWIGVLKSGPMKRTWRHAVVGIAVVGLFITPSNDLFSMFMMIIPVIILYVGSIWLVAFIERKRERKAL